MEGVEESEDKWTWHLCDCLSRHFILTAFMAATSHDLPGLLQAPPSPSASSTSGLQGRGAGRGSSTLAEFAKGQTTTLEGKGWRRCVE